MNSQSLRKSFFGVLALMPLALPLVVTNSYYMNGLINQILIFTLLIASLDLIIGHIGDISLGHASFFGVGAYIVAILTATPALNSSTETSMLYFPQLSFWVAIGIAVFVTALFGLLFSYPSLRLSGDYLAVTTLALGLIVHTVLNESEALTNGTKGIHLPPIQVGGWNLEENNFFWMLYPTTLAVLWMIRNLDRSYWGRAFKAIKLSGVAAESVGIHRARFKTLAFCLSAGIAGLAGGLYSQLNNYVGTNAFGMELSFMCVAVLILGGVRSVLGNFLGVAMYILLPEFLHGFKDFHLLAFSVLLLLVLYFAPRGLAGFLAQIWTRTCQRVPPLNRFFVEPSLTLTPSTALAKQALTFVQTHPASQAPLLELRQVSKNFGGVQAIKNVSLRVQAGSIHGLMGPNGSGKSTLINLISGIYPTSAGSIQFLNQDVNTLNPSRRAEKGMARTFQNLQLFSDLTCLENVLVGRHMSFQSPLWKVLLHSPRTLREEKSEMEHAWALLQFLGLEKLAQQKAGELSYGQARRLELCRALACKPRILLLDEPAAGFNGAEISELNDLILRLRQSGLTVVLIEHHMEMLMKICDKISVLKQGALIAEGTPFEVQQNPQVVAAYLGEKSA